MEIFVLASGSKGNMTYVKNDIKSFFVDAGINLKSIESKMQAYGEDISQVDTLLITHEHSDHIIGLKALLKKGFIKHVYLTKGTYQALSLDVKSLLPEKHIIKADVPFKLFDYDCLPIMLSHDANEPVGFRFDWNDKRFVYLTDTGYVDASYMDVLKDADVYLLESNHDPKRLLDSRRPFQLKQRILGMDGHLSNEDAALLINKLTKNKKATWIVAHISEECNHQFDIEKAIVDHVENLLNIQVVFASQEALEGIKI